MEEKWYNLTVEQTAAKLKTDINTGLNDKNAADRLHREGPNTLYNIPRSNFGRMCGEVMRDPTAYMLLCAVLLGLFFDQAVNAGIITALVVFNWAAVLFIYYKVQKRMNDTSYRALPTATVLRNSKKYIIKQNKLCRGDIILLTKGDVVPADARVVNSNGLVLREGALTGDPVLKRKSPDPVYGNALPIEQHSDMVFATTVVVEGNGSAIVCRTGKGNMAVKLGKVPTVAENTSLPALKKLKKYSYTWSMVSLAVIFILTALEYIAGFGTGGLYSVFVTSLALCSSGMCELYVVLGYIIFGIGLYGSPFKKEKGYEKAEVKRSLSIDKLAGITTLIIPKDGALGSGSVRLEKLWCDNTLMSATDKHLERLCEDLVCSALDSTSYAQNDYEKAFNRFKSKNCSAQEQVIFNFVNQLGIFGFGYTAAHMMTEHKEEILQGNVSKSLITDGRRNKLVMRGGVEDILPLCCDYRTNERAKSIKNEKTHIKDAVNRAVKEGYTVVCVASKYTEAKTIGQTQKDRDFVFEGFLCISEPRLLGAKEKTALMKNNGINVIMLCDEADVANRNYAKSIGIISNDEEIMPASDFRRISELNFNINAGRFKFYECLDTVQKRRLVSLLRKNGEVVGCFGNDFDDISVLEESDVAFSAAMTLTRGNGITDVSSETSPIPLLDSDEKGRGCDALSMVSDVILPPANKKAGGFNAMALTVLRAKRLLCNLNDSVRYLICSHSARISAVMIALLIAKLGFEGLNIAPMTAPQLLFSGLVMDLLSVMVFAFSGKVKEQKNTYYQSALMYNVKTVGIGFWWAAIAVVLPVFAFAFGAGFSAAQSATMVFYGFLLTHPVVTCETLCKGSVIREITNVNKLVFVELGAALLVILLSALSKGFGSLFGVTALNGIQWGLTLVLPVTVFGLFEVSKMFFVKDGTEEKEADSDENA
ncbi:MAG: cation-transporting P-type ATPase [Ruminococcaceae bacterium]|nr:cation-transporting P-type ATPase [Oscillospiraceae bacterium]